MTESALKGVVHEANVVDWCHGMTGGAKIRCSCGDWWVVGNQRVSEDDVRESIWMHQKEKRANGD